MPRSSLPRARGFTLVELMVVVTIISMLAMVAVPAVQRIQRKAKTTAIVNDFRVFASAFDTYSHQNGTWPAETAVGAIPAVMVGSLQSASWLRVTPMGGKYNWDNNQLHLGYQYRAAVSIASAPGATLVLDVNQIVALEQAIDGNDLDWFGGSFRLGNALNPVFVIQP